MDHFYHWIYFLANQVQQTQAMLYEQIQVNRRLLEQISFLHRQQQHHYHHDSLRNQSGHEMQTNTPARVLITRAY